MNEIDDESLQGSYIIQENPTIPKKIKPHFKEGVEHRFHEDTILRVVADEPIITYLKTHNNKWTSARQLINKCKMAERTVFHMCRRLVLHEILEMKRDIIPDDNGAKRSTRLYRLVVKKTDDSRRDKKGNKPVKSNA